MAVSLFAIAIVFWGIADWNPFLEVAITLPVIVIACISYVRYFYRPYTWSDEDRKKEGLR